MALGPVQRAPDHTTRSFMTKKIAALLTVTLTILGFFRLLASKTPLDGRVGQFDGQGGWPGSRVAGAAGRVAMQAGQNKLTISGRVSNILIIHCCANTC